MNIVTPIPQNQKVTFTRYVSLKKHQAIENYPFLKDKTMVELFMHRRQAKYNKDDHMVDAINVCIKEYTPIGLKKGQSNLKPRWKHQFCTIFTKTITKDGFAESQTWCQTHNERIVTMPK